MEKDYLSREETTALLKEYLEIELIALEEILEEGVGGYVRDVAKDATAGYKKLDRGRQARHIGFQLIKNVLLNILLRPLGIQLFHWSYYTDTCKEQVYKSNAENPKLAFNQCYIKACDDVLKKLQAAGSNCKKMFGFDEEKLMKCQEKIKEYIQKYQEKREKFVEKARELSR